MTNRVCELLETEHPIIQGGMSWVSDASLAAAVSNGGGLGVIGAGTMPPEALREEIIRTRELTDKPFGVNMIMINPEFGDQLDVVLKEKPAVITLGAVQSTTIIPEIREKGIRVLPVVAAVAMARRAEQHGADAIIAEGSEAGGHIGETTTMVLTPLISRSVEIPVLAAGGIVDGATLVAAFALGAEGVQMGTRFVCATECTAHEAVKEKFIKAGDRATVVTARAIGYPVRSIKNKLSAKYADLERDFLLGKRSVEEIERYGLGKLREAMREGNVRDGSMMAGQDVALVDRIQPAGEIISEIVAEAEAEAGRLLSRLTLRR